MNNRLLSALFICNLIPYIVGNSLLPFLPIYATELGADEALAGVYLALAFVGLTAGSLFSGWFSDHFQLRKILAVIGPSISFPMIFLMGQVTDFQLLIPITMIVWFTGGLSITTVNILVGIYADPSERGRTFGIIGLTLGLAQIIAGLMAGRVVDRWGITSLFVILAGAQLIQLTAALTLKEQKVPVQEKTKRDGSRPVVNRAFWLLMIASVGANVMNSLGGLARPLAMNAMNFDGNAIASTILVSGLVTLPLPFLIGRLSDRIGRKQLLALCYLCVSLASFILAGAVELWQFWLSTALFSLLGASMVVGSALITDIVRPESLGTALSRFAATPWMSGIIGFGSAGFITQAIGFQPTFLLGASLTLVFVVMVGFIRQGQPEAVQSS